MTDAIRFPEGDEPYRVCVVECGDAPARQRDAIALATGDAIAAYALRDRAEVSPIDSILGLARGGASIWSPPDMRAPIEVMHFVLPEACPPQRIEMKLEKILAGEVAGHYRFVMEQNGFHRAHWAFEALRRIAGDPPVVLSKHRHDDGDGDLAHAASKHPSVAMGRAAFVPADPAEMLGAQGVFPHHAIYDGLFQELAAQPPPEGDRRQKSGTEVFYAGGSTCSHCGGTMEPDLDGELSCTLMVKVRNLRQIEAVTRGARRGG